MRILLTFALYCLALTTFGQSLPGCTDPTASNYNADATQEDGTCCYLIPGTVTSTGLAYVTFTNYSSWVNQYISLPGTFPLCLSEGCYEAIVTNNSDAPITVSWEVQGIEPFSIELPAFSTEAHYFSIGEISYGCTDYFACNYDPNAICNDLSCDYSCYGCTNPNSVNYDEGATIDDGTCCTDNSFWYTIDATGPVVVQASDNYASYSSYALFPEDQGLCHPLNCINFNLFNPESTEVELTITNSSGVVIYSGSVQGNESSQFVHSTDGIVGCTDQGACNYNPDATCSDYWACTYDCLGCTDPTAINFNPDATIDNGSCCTETEYVYLTASQQGTAYVYSYQNNFSNYIQINANEPFGFCLEDGCYFLDFMSGGALNDISVSIDDYYGNNLYSGTTFNNIYYGQFSKNGTTGCADPTACNYDPTVSCPDYVSCDYSCYGCTNADALNFDPTATQDDGTCCFAQYTITTSSPINWVLYGGNFQYGSQYGGTDYGIMDFCIGEGCFNLYIYSTPGLPGTYEITDQDGTLINSGSFDEFGFNQVGLEYNVISGCADQAACNYNPEANCFDYYSCNYDCYGCNDPTASNYDDTALFNDGTCCYNTFYTVELNGEGYWFAYSLTNYTTLGSTNYSNNSGFCSDGECFGFTVYSTFGLPITYTIYNPDGSVYLTGTSDEYGYVNEAFSNTEVVGCSDSNACNYDPAATCGLSYLCDYSCLGCTDPSAPNYDPSATQDDGSCCYNNWHTLSFNQSAFWNAFNGLTGEVFSGNYPTDAGFCMDAECFIIQAWSYDGSPLEFTLYNPAGETILSGVTENYGLLNTTVSNGDEISGCTDPNACNFNPDATCDAGACNYYCGGCTNPDAINYNANALWEDGSCFFSIEPPQMQLVVEDVEAQDFYFVRMDVMEIGNGAPYVVSSDYNTEMMMISNNGQYLAGPFECGSTVEFTVSSATYGLMEYTVTDPVGGACTIISTEEIETEQTFGVYPNPSNGFITISGIENTTYQAQILDMTGRVVFQQQINGQTAGVQLNIEALAKGYYTLQLSNENSVMSRGIVKE